MISLETTFRKISTHGAACACHQCSQRLSLSEQRRVEGHQSGKVRPVAEIRERACKAVRRRSRCPSFARTLVILVCLILAHVWHEPPFEVLEALPGPVCPIAFVGDGRSGKSFLASKLAGQRSIMGLEPSIRFPVEFDKRRPGQPTLLGSVVS